MTYRRVDTWIRGGLIRASGRSADGKGSRRLFLFSDLVEIRVLRGLTAKGVRLQSLKKSISQLRRLMPENQADILASTRLVTDGKSVFRLLDGDRLESLDEFGQYAFAFGFGMEAAHVAETVRNQGKPIRYVKKSESVVRRKATAG